MRHHLRPLLAQELMANCCFSILTQSEQLLEDYKALDLLIFHFKCYLSWAVLANELFTLPFLPISSLLSPYALPKYSQAKTRAYKWCTLTKLQLTGFVGGVFRLSFSGLTLRC